LKVGGEDTGICDKEKPCNLILDSGTSILTGPTKEL
jgi:hypothetical protein